MASRSTICLVVFALFASSAVVANAQVQAATGTLGVERGGSCGYTPNFPPVGTYLTGFSEELYGAGELCGGCYVVTCVNSDQCRPGARVVVTATNECMATNTTAPCTKPNAALNLQPAAFDQIATSRAPGIVGINYIPVPCVRTGGVHLLVTTGNQYYLAVLIQNVAGPGALSAVYISAGATVLRPVPMKRSFGAVWEVTNLQVVGVPLSFRLVGRDGSILDIPAGLPANWTPQKLYITNKNYNLPAIAKRPVKKPLLKPLLKPLAKPLLP